MESRRTLDYQIERIDIALFAHKLGVRVADGSIGPRWVRFRLAIPYGVRPEAVLRLEADLANKMGGGLRVTQDRDGQVYVEIQREKGYYVGLTRLIDAYRATPPALSAVLGVDVAGMPLWVRLPAPDVAHILVAGTTGSGKTVLARSIILSLAAFNPPGHLQLLLVDPKDRKFTDLTGLPHLLTGVITDVGHGIHALSEMERLMVERDRAHVSEPRIVCVVDELADLVMTDAGILQPITRLAQRGREAGLHLILCTQKPTADVLGRFTKVNIPVRLVGSVPTPEEAKIASGLAQTGAEKLLGRGEFLLVAHGRVEARFQAAYAGATSSRYLIEHIRGAVAEGPGAVERQARWDPPDLRVVVDNRGVEADVRRVLRTPGWIDQWWDRNNLRFNYGHLSAIGRVIDREVEGAGYHYVNKVAEKLRDMLCGTSTTTPGARTFTAGDENASGQE